MRTLCRIILVLGGVAVLAACTPRRTDDRPQADGDTIEVVISTPTGITTDTI